MYKTCNDSDAASHQSRSVNPVSCTCPSKPLPARKRTHWHRIRNAGREEKLLLCDSWLKEVLHRRLTNLIISGYQPRLCKRHCGYSTTRAHMRNLTTGSFIWALLDESSSHRDPLVRVGHPESLARVERKHTTLDIRRALKDKTYQHPPPEYHVSHTKDHQVPWLSSTCTSRIDHSSEC